MVVNYENIYNKWSGLAMVVGLRMLMRQEIRFKRNYLILAYKDGSIGQRQSLLGEKIFVPMGTRG